MLVPFALVGLFCTAQLSTLPAAKAIAELPGPPQNPPIFSAMTAIWQGGLQYEDTAVPKGPVAEVQREEIQSPGQSPNPYHTATTLRFDDQEHMVTRIREDSMGTSTETNIFDDGKLQSQTVQHHRTDHKFADWKEWQRWTYDARGRLSEFKAGWMGGSL